MKRVLLALSFVGLTLALTGCPPSPDEELVRRYPIHGTVAVDGEPMESGSIAFVATGTTSTGEKQRPAGGQIENGKYDIPEAKGPNDGEYRVLISWNKPTGKQVMQPDGNMGPEYTEGLPPKYSGSESELTLTLPVENNEKNWELTTK